MKEQNSVIDLKLKRFHDVDQYEDIGGDLLARDMCLVDNCVFRRGK
jgi:hypothetical protein